MHNRTAFMQCMEGVIGWHQTENPDFGTLTPSLLLSSSGRYFQDEHPLMTIKNIDLCFENYSMFNYPVFDLAIIYEQYTIVQHNDLIYESLTGGNVGNSPDVSPNEWGEVNQLSRKLLRLMRTAYDEVSSKLWIKKKLNESTKSIFDKALIFDGPANKFDRNVNEGRFVGFAIEPKNYQSLALLITKIGTQFTQQVNDLNLYLFHTSQELPITTINVDHNQSNSFVWHEPSNEVRLRFYSDTVDAGFWILGYYEDDIAPGVSIRKDYNFGTIPSRGSCCRHNYEYYMKRRPYYNIVPISVASADIAGISPNDPEVQLFDLNNIRYHYDDNFGLNLEMSVICDVTDVLCSFKHNFVDACLKEVAVRVLMEIAHNTRDNEISRLARDRALYELNSKENPDNIKMERDKAMKALDFDISEIDKLCIPYKDQSGISYGYR